MGSEPRSDASLLPLLAGSCAWQGLEDQQPLECMQRVWENGRGLVSPETDMPYISRVLPTHSALTRHCESELADLSSDPNSLGKSFLTILYPSSEL